MRAQSPAVKLDVRAAKGLVVSPIYEGWYKVDGTKYALFSDYNRNLEEVVDIPIGAGNKVAPGPPIRRSRRASSREALRRVRRRRAERQLKTEVTWTLTANGQTLSIPVFSTRSIFISPQRETGRPIPATRRRS